jgi:ABC-type uncharacterized transport system substrate-binding protein
MGTHTSGRTVGLKIDVIVAVGARETRASNEFITTIPIVVGDVLERFRHKPLDPGGNITGLSTCVRS